MHRTFRAGLLFAILSVSACGGGGPPTFDPQAFAGKWSGGWRDDGGRRGGLELNVVDHGDRLEFVCDLMGGGLPGLTPPVERFTAGIEPHRAIIADQTSRTFGAISGSLDADGYLIIDCEGVLGPAKDLHAEGTWTDDSISLEVELTYDGSMRQSGATVEMKRR